MSDTIATTGTESRIDPGSDLGPPAHPSIKALEGPVASRGAHRVLQRLLEGRGWSALRLGTDLVFLYLAVLAAWLGAPDTVFTASLGIQIGLLPLITVGLLLLRGGYRDRLQVGALDWVGQIVGATALAAMSLLALDKLLLPEAGPSGLLVRAWIFGTLYVAGGRILLAMVRRGAQAERVIGKPTLIVGAGGVGAQVERRLQTHPELGLLPIGYLDADPLPGELLPGRRAPVLGPPEDLGRIAEETGAQHVIFAFLTVPDQVLVPLVHLCQERELEMSVVPRLFDSINTRVQLEHMGGLPLYALRGTNLRGWQFTVKHALGKLIAAVLLLVLSPLILATAAAVRLTSPGPLLFRQRRIGRDGQQFDLLKFRSMTVSTDSRNGAEADKRPPLVEDGMGPGGVEDASQDLTPVGGFIRRTSLDELPQLWNVLRGDMTLVGPRPERPEFVELFGQSVRRYDERHRVKSGITGWAQVHGLRGRTSLADRVEWDNFYIENWSLWLDLKILVMTLGAPFKHVE
jgi:exopolysaccharide biosynthesis polyprenyl glycosylphosphotransferase